MLYLRKSLKKSEVTNFLTKSGYTITSIKQVLAEAGISISSSEYSFFKKCTSYVNFIGAELAWKSEYEGARIKKLIISTVKNWPKSGSVTNYWNLYQIFSAAGYNEFRCDKLSPEYIAQELINNEINSMITNGVQ